MATLQRVDGADFSAGAIGLVPPVSRGLAGIFLLGGSLELSRRNLAPGASGPGTLVGSPTVSSAFLTFTGNSAYINTQVPETNAMTLCVVARAPLLASGNRPGLIGNYANTPTGAGIFIDGPAGGGFPQGTVRLNATVGSTVGASSLTDPDASAWGYYEGRVANGAGSVVRERTAGVTGTTSATSGTRTLNAVAPNLRIGSIQHNTYGGNCDVALAIIHNVVLTDAEADATYAWAKAVITKRLAVTV